MLLFPTTFLLAVFILIFSVFKFGNKFVKNGFKKYVTGPKGIPIFGVAFNFISRDPVVIFKQIQRYLLEWKGIFKCSIFHYKFIFISLPEDVEVIMTDHKFWEKSTEYNIMRPWLQDGILTVKTKNKWQQMRKILLPAFHYKILDGFVETFDEKANILVNILAEKHGDGRPFDVSSYITLCTLDAVCQTIMGVKINAQTVKDSSYVKNILEISSIVFWRFHHFLGREDWYWNLTPQKRRHDYLIKQNRKFTSKVVEKRRKILAANPSLPKVDEFNIKTRSTLIDVLFESKVDDKPFTDEDILSEIDSFMLAGHDTITSALDFLLYNLAKYPDKQRLVYEEIVNEFGRDKSCPLTLSKLNNLNYLEAAIKESLRLFPPVPFIGRINKEDSEINGKTYPANHSILISMYHMHRSPKYFDDPDTFKPERFLGQSAQSDVMPFSYVPFSGGYRNCIGQKFAQYEIKSIMSRLVQAFEISLGDENFEPQLTSALVLLSANGINLKLSKRLSFWETIESS